MVFQQHIYDGPQEDHKLGKQKTKINKGKGLKSKKQIKMRKGNFKKLDKNKIKNRKCNFKKVGQKTKIKSGVVCGVVWCGVGEKGHSFVMAVSRTEPTKNKIKTGKRDIDALQKTKIKSGGITFK